MKIFFLLILFSSVARGQVVLDTVIFRFSSGDIKYLLVRNAGEAVGTSEDSLFVSHNRKRAMISPYDLPLSNAVIAALAAKQSTLGFTPVPNTRTVNGQALSGNVTLTAGDVGLGNVNNTSDATKNSASAYLTSKTLGAFNVGLDAGANDSYTITVSPAPAAYTQGMIIFFRANTQNTTGCSINVNGLGVKTIVKRVNTTPATGDILAQMWCFLIYDGTNFVLLNPVVN